MSYEQYFKGMYHKTGKVKISDNEYNYIFVIHMDYLFSANLMKY